MKTLIELKQAAESKGLRFEVNKWDPTIRPDVGKPIKFLILTL